MKTMKIKVVKLYSGDFIIGEIDDNAQMQMPFNIKVKISNPRSFRLMPSMSGGIAVSLTAVSAPFKSVKLSQEIEIDSAQIMFIIDENELDSELITGYKSEISGIKMPSVADTVALSK